MILHVEYPKVSMKNKTVNKFHNVAECKIDMHKLFLFYTLINETSENQKLREKQTNKKPMYLKSHQKGLNT